VKTRVLALTAMTVLMAAPAATAATNTLTGKLSRTVGADGSKVTIKVKTNKSGVVTKVTSFELKNAQTECLDKETNSLEPGPRVSASLGSFAVQKFETSAGTVYTFSGKKSIGGVTHNVGGDFASKKGRAVTGTISGPGDTEKCRIVRAEFSAKRK
jgi:hypothetical protein